MNEMKVCQPTYIDMAGLTRRAFASSCTVLEQRSCIVLRWTVLQILCKYIIFLKNKNKKYKVSDRVSWS